jgi:Arc/MetJ-type ribon-helix-helix transcriptional regulator
MASRGNYVSFRAPVELTDAIDALVESSRADGIPANRSIVVRTLLRRGLDEDPTGGETKEVLATVWRASQAAIGRVVELVRKELPGAINTAFEEISGTSGE